jgi:anti-sigma-K factor RskA
MSDPRLDNLDVAAAEYVLGVGDVAAREAATARLETDTVFERAVEAWIQRLGPLAENAAPIAPPDVWPAIERETGAMPVDYPPIAANDNRLGFWRAWAIAASAVAALAAAGLMFLMMRPSLAPPHQMLATLRTADGAADVVVSFNTGSRDLVLTPVGAMPPPGKTPHLWLKEKNGAMRWLGPVDMAHPRRTILSRAMAKDAEGAMDVMVSLEPASLTAMTRPSGPIVAHGAFRLV